VASKAERRYGNPPKIKLAMPTPATANAAKPVATTETSGDGVPVTATHTTQGDKRV